MNDQEIEHVARAICAALGHDADKRLQFDPTQIIDPPVMLRTPQPAWTFWATQATAHIAAFRAMTAVRDWRFVVRAAEVPLTETSPVHTGED